MAARTYRHIDDTKDRDCLQRRQLVNTGRVRADVSAELQRLVTCQGGCFDLKRLRIAPHPSPLFHFNRERLASNIGSEHSRRDRLTVGATCNASRCGSQQSSLGGDNRGGSNMRRRPTTVACQLCLGRVKRCCSGSPLGGVDTGPSIRGGDEALDSFSVTRVMQCSVQMCTRVITGSPNMVRGPSPAAFRL